MKKTSSEGRWGLGGGGSRIYINRLFLWNSMGGIKSAVAAALCILGAKQEAEKMSTPSHENSSRKDLSFKGFKVNSCLGYLLLVMLPYCCACK